MSSLLETQMATTVISHTVIDMLLLEIGTEIINNSNGSLRSISDQWTQTWLSTFNGNQASPQSIYFYIVKIAQLIVLPGLVFSILKMYTYAKKVEDPVQVALIAGQVAILAALAYNNYNLTGEAAFGIRSLTNGWQKDILATQINAVNFNGAINDRFLLNDTKAILRGIKDECDAIVVPANVIAISLTRPQNPNPPLTEGQSKFYDKMECYDRLGREAKKLRTEANYVGCSFKGVVGDCKGLIGWLEDFERTFSNNLVKTEQQIQTKGKMETDYLNQAFSNWLGGKTAEGTLLPLFYGLQFGFTQLMEAGHWIAGVSGPLAVAFSLFPNNGMPMFLQWLVYMFAIGFMKIIYALMVGVSAQSLSVATGGGLNETAFGLIIGVLAPAIAFGLATGGAAAAVNAMAGTSLAVIAGLSSFGASLIGGAAGLLK